MITIFKDYKLRNIEKMQTSNKGDRTLFESLMVPEVITTLKDWIDNNNSNCMLIGGSALSYYIKPRYTEDVDVLYLSFSDIPDNVNLFKSPKKHRNGAFLHIQTHVEVEIVTPKSINLNQELAEEIFNTCNIVDNIKIASPSGLVALKLTRFSLQDQADISELIKASDIDLTQYKNLTDENLSNFQKIVDYNKKSE